MGAESLNIDDLDDEELADLIDDLDQVFVGKGYQEGDSGKLYARQALRAAKLAQGHRQAEANSVGTTRQAEAQAVALTAEAIAAADRSRLEAEASVERLRKQAEYDSRTIGGRTPAQPAVRGPSDSSGAVINRIA